MDQVTKQSKQNPVEFPIHIRSGIEGQVVTAKRRLPELRKEIQEATFPERVVAIFATCDVPGSKPLVDTEVFLSQNGGIVLNADDVYREIADLVEPSYSSQRLYNTAQHNLTVQAMKIILERVGGLDIMDVPRYKEAICKTYEDTVGHIRSIMETVPDNEIQLRHIRDEITFCVIEEGLAGKTVPVLIYNFTEAEVPALSKLFKKLIRHTFEADFEPSHDAIVKILKS